MTAVSALIFPPGRILAGWWKHLAGLQPQGLWVGHLLLHRVEALVALQKPLHLDPFLRLILRAVAVGPGQTAEQLDQLLHLGCSLVRQILRRLQSEKLLQVDASGGWSLTLLGRQGMEQGSYPCSSLERRGFYFVQSEQPAGSPHFLDVRNHPATVPWQATDGWQFDAAILQACLQQPAAWKQHTGFPLEVQEIVGLGTSIPSSGISPQAWERIIFDQPLRLMAALVTVRASESGEKLLGFAVREVGWILQAAEPAFVVNTAWSETLRDLPAEPATDLWRQAWREWCQPRGIPAPEVDACILQRQDCRVRIIAPSRLVERLRAVRSDVFKGGAWLLAGTGRLRTAARVELVESVRAGGEKHF